MTKQIYVTITEYELWPWKGPPPRWLRCVWQLTGGLGCGSGKVRDITEVPEEGHDELCYSGKA